MPVAVGGLNHKIAPLEVRERLAFSSAELGSRLAELREKSGLDELTVLSTCNRTELYAYGDDESSLVDGLEKAVSSKYGGPIGFSADHLYLHTDRNAVNHLFRVSCSLDSMILGESQILGQVREAYRLSQETLSSGRVLSRLFQQAMKVGKRARNETAIGSGAVSISSASVDLARKIFGNLGNKQAMILGAGETSELTLSLLVDSGVDTVLVANRTYQRAVDLALKYQGSAVQFDEFQNFLSQSDILISSTSAPGYVIDRAKVGKALERRSRPIFMIDLAVPRDIDPALGDYENCFLYNLDDLQQVVQQNLNERQSQVGMVEEIIASETMEFMEWYESLSVVPLIKSLHSSFDSIRNDEMEKVKSKLAHLGEDDLALIDKFAYQLSKKFLHLPTSRIKENPNKFARMSHTEIVRFLFGLDEGSKKGGK